MHKKSQLRTYPEAFRQELAVSRKDEVRMKQTGQPWLHSLPRAAWLVLAAGVAVMTGCETDSFFDPSITGRWEYTPTELPILERLDVIEDDQGDFSDASDITPEDLQPVIEEYHFGPGDGVHVEVWDLFGRDQLVPFDRIIDSRGMIDLGVIGEVRAQGTTSAELREEIIKAVRDKGLVNEPVVSVQPTQQRRSTFSVLGAAAGGSGTLFISKPDYRILQAITDAGGVLETIPYIYVIRQVPLTEGTSEGVTPSGEVYNPETQGNNREEDKDKTSLPEYLEQLLDENSGGAPPAMLPGDLHRHENRVRRATPPVQDKNLTAGTQQPVTEPQTENPAETIPVAVTTAEQEQPPAAAETTESPAVPIDLPPAPGQEQETAETTESSVIPAEELQKSEEETQHPVVELPEEPAITEQPEENQAVIDLPETSPEMDNQQTAEIPATPYIFVNGEWVAVQTEEGSGKTVSESGKNEPVTTLNPITGEMMTQRIIRVPVKPLLRGEAKYNIVIRPGDILRIPPPPTGNLYMGGEVNRPGTYNLPVNGRMTLKQAIFAAGGLNPLGIPERVDLIRRLGENREATVRLNLRAIFEGTEPDLFLKPNDMINVGTNFAAAPLAVMRNGFRATYGFGFLLDRNFGNDIFGPPPINRR